MMGNVYPNIFLGLSKMQTGWQLKKCGWQNADNKMQMAKCGRKNGDDKMQMTNRRWKIVNDYMQMIKCLWGEIDLRCFMTVPVVNKPSHLIQFRLGEVQYFLFNP